MQRTIEIITSKRIKCAQAVKKKKGREGGRARKLASFRPPPEAGANYVKSAAEHQDRLTRCPDDYCHIPAALLNKYK